MKYFFLAVLISLPFYSLPLHASQLEDDKRELQRLINDEETPYLGPGRSTMDAYKDTAEIMVKDYGIPLSQVGIPPETIRSTTLYTCKDAENSAEHASSISELDLWRDAKLNAISASDPSKGDPTTAFTYDLTNRCYKLSKILYLLNKLIENQTPMPPINSPH